MHMLPDHPLLSASTVALQGLDLSGEGSGKAVQSFLVGLEPEQIIGGVEVASPMSVPWMRGKVSAFPAARWRQLATAVGSSLVP